MGDVATGGVVGMAADVVPEQPRSVPSTTPGDLAGWAVTQLRPVL